MDYISNINIYFDALWYVAVFSCAAAAYRCNNIYNRLFGYLLIFATLFVDFIYSSMVGYNYHLDIFGILKFKISYFLSIAMMFVFLSILIAALSNHLKRKGFSDTKNTKARYLKYFFIGSCLLIIAPIETILEYFYDSSDTFDISKSFIDFLYIWAAFDWMLIISTGYYLYCFYEIFSNGDKNYDRVGIFSVLFGGRLNRSPNHFSVAKGRKK